MMVMTLAIGIVTFIVVMVVMLMLLVLMLMLLVLMLVFVFVMMMVMTLAIGIVTFIVVMVMMVLMCRLSKTCQLFLNGVATLHCRQQLLAVQVVPRGGDDGSRGIVCTQQCYRLGNLFLGNTARVRQHDASCVFDLVIEEFTEILHIHLALFHVGNRGKAVEHNPLCGNTLHGTDNIGKLANPRGLDQNAVGRVVGEHLLQCLAEVTHQRAADTAAVHFGHFDPRILHEAAVDADLTEFVFDQNQLFARIHLIQKLFDQRGLSRAQKT